MCRDLSRNNCRMKKENLVEEEIQMQLGRFDCSVTGQKLLTAMENSPCATDRLLFQDFKDSIQDCNGIYEKKMTRLQRKGLLTRTSFCRENSDWNGCAKRLAKMFCGKDFGMYAEYRYSVYDKIRYRSMCSKCNDPFICGDELLGVGLVDSSGRLNDTLFDDSYTVNKFCKSWQSCSETFSRIRCSRRSRDEIKVKQDMLIMNLVCSEFGHQSRSSPCKKGTREYEMRKKYFDPRHPAIARANGIITSPCRFFEDWVDSARDVSASYPHCGQPLAMHYLREYAISKTEHFENITCDGLRPGCWFNCEDLLPRMISSDPQPFLFSWISKFNRTLHRMCGPYPIVVTNRETLRQCWNIREAVCLDSEIKTEIRKWRELQDVLCTEDVIRPGVMGALNTACAEPPPSSLLTNLDRQGKECHEILDAIFNRTTSLSPDTSTCEIIENAEKCVLKAALGACGKEYRWLVSKIWTISLRDDVAAVKKQCYAECLDGWSVVPGTSTCVKAFDVGKSWTEARKSCGENADLVKITDRNMNKFIVGLTAKPEISSTIFWIGLNDRKLEEEYRWLDETTQAKLHGQSFFQLARSEDHDCVMMSNTTWTVSDCDNTPGYICEMPAMNRVTHCMDMNHCIREISRRNDRKMFVPLHVFFLFGANSSVDVCSRLDNCFGQHLSPCLSDPDINYVKRSYDTLCSTFGSNLISHTRQSKCLWEREFSKFERAQEHLNIRPEDEDDQDLVCRKIRERLLYIEERARWFCGMNAAPLITDIYTQSYAIYYGCEDRRTTCFQLVYCLENTVKSYSSAWDYFDWTYPFHSSDSFPDIRSLCRSKRNIVKCYVNYGRFCPDTAYVTEVEKAVRIFEYICKSLSSDEKSLSVLHLLDTIIVLNHFCVNEFYALLNRADREVFESKATDDIPRISDKLCRKIEVTNRECLRRATKQWSKSEDIPGSGMTWTVTWLFAMGDRFQQVRDRCYGIQACPLWSKRSQSAISCFVLHQSSTYKGAKAFCKRTKGELVKISSLRKFLEISDFLSARVSLLPPASQFSIWFNSESDDAWLKEMDDIKLHPDCPVITGPNANQLWYLQNKPCDQRSLFICETPIDIKATCPTGWTLNPAGDLCVKALDSPLSRGNQSAVCIKDGMGLFEYKTMDTSWFINGLLPLDPNRKFWVENTDPTYRKTTKCAFVNINTIPGILGSLEKEDCSKALGGICVIHSFQRSAESATTPSMSINVRKFMDVSSCPYGWREMDESSCVQQFTASSTRRFARMYCEGEGASLLVFKYSRSRWQFFRDYTSIIGEYWIKVENEEPACSSLSRTADRGVAVIKKSKDECEKLYLNGFICERRREVAIRPTDSPTTSTQSPAVVHGNRDPACADGWREMDESSCVRSFISSTKWYLARKFCEDEGANLLDYSESRWQFFRDDESITGEYWIKVEISMDEEPACRSLTRTAEGELTLIKRTIDECEELTGDGFICERKQEVTNRPTESPTTSTHSPAVVQGNRASPTTSTQLPTVRPGKRVVCEIGQWMYQGFCYGIIDKPKSWKDARSHCRSKGGDLVKFSSTDDRRRFYIRALAVDYSRHKLWLGLYGSKNDGIYRWMDDSNIVDPAVYGTVPDTNAGADNTQCLMVNPDTGSSSPWNFEDCNSLQRFLCEYPYGQAPKESPCPRGWQELDKSCVGAYSSKTTWSSARGHCENNNGRLLDFVTSESRWQFLRNFGSFLGKYWIGVAEEQSANSEVACRYLIRSEADGTRRLAKVSMKDCEGMVIDGYICEEKQGTARTN